MHWHRRRLCGKIPVWLTVCGYFLYQRCKTFWSPSYLTKILMHVKHWLFACFSVCSCCTRLCRLSVSCVPLAVAVDHVVITCPSWRRSRRETLVIAHAVPGRRQHQLDVTPRDGRDADAADHQSRYEGCVPWLRYKHKCRLWPKGHSLPCRLPNGQPSRRLSSPDSQRRASEYVSLLSAHRSNWIHQAWWHALPKILILVNIWWWWWWSWW